MKITTEKKLVLALFIGGILAASQASAHVVYPKALYNDTGTNPAHTTTGVNQTSFGTGPTQTFTATSNVGWYSGSSAGLAQVSSDWNAYRTINGGIPAGATASVNGANSHDSKVLYFALAQESLVSFNISANTSVSSGQTGVGAFQPALSIYSGLAPYLAHDGAAGNTAATAHALALDSNGFAPWSQFYGAGPTAQNGNAASLWGVYRSDASWSIGHDSTVTAFPNGDPVNGFDYGELNLVGYATNDGQHFGDVSNIASGVGGTSVGATFDLQPGVYTVYVAGNDSSLLSGYLAALFASAGLPVGPENCTTCAGRTLDISAYRAKFGFDITTSVQAVPIPAAVWLFGSALGGLGLFGRRKSASKV